MKKIRLGSAGPDINRIGLGTWAIGGSGWQFAWGAQDDADSIAAIRRAIDLGINWIDTAALYGLGHSEEVVGQAIDLYQIHWPQPDEELEEGWAEIAKSVREGKVRWAGVSNFNVEQLKRVQAIHPVTSLQPPLSMLRRGVEQDLLPYCAANGIGVICYSPMQAGLLTGAFTRERAAALPGDDWRRNSPFFKEPELSANLAVVDGLRVIAARRGCSVGELAIAWVLRRPGVTGAIVGARRPEQIEGTIGAAGLFLTVAELAEIEELLAARERALEASP
jgi:aryl-alcohol dehydrogenase-like predicted oxidoreductase